MNKIEDFFGEIKLDSCVYATPLDSTYTVSKVLKQKNWILYIGYRNEVLVEKIVGSVYTKIVVLYGAAHRKGVKKILKDKQ